MENIDFIFLDSGTGGLPYMQYLNGCCPHAKCVYIADTKNFPYGEKTAEQIIHAASNVVSLALSKWNPKAIVLACNTMSVTALPFLRNHFPDVPFIGTVPAIKLAAELSHNGRIGLLATNKTVTDPYTKELIEKYASDCLVFSRGDSDLIDFIEHNYWRVMIEVVVQFIFVFIIMFDVCFRFFLS